MIKTKLFNSITCVICALTITSYSEGADVAPSARTYYVDAEIGSDASDGQTPDTPFQSLERVNGIKLEAGDSILLGSGQTFKGELKIENESGDASNHIVVSSTGKEKAVIDGRGCSAALSILSSSFVTVKNLELTADGGGPMKGGKTASKARCGLLFDTPAAGDYRGLVFEDLHIHDVFYNEKDYVRPLMKKKRLIETGHHNHGWAAKVGCRKDSTLKDVTFRNCTVERASHSGIRLTCTPIDSETPGMENIRILDCRVRNVGGPGIVVSAATNTTIRGCRTSFTGSMGDPRNRGQGTGIWVFNNNNALIEKNTVTGAQGPHDSAGIHIDALSRNVVVQHNLSMNKIDPDKPFIGAIRPN